MKGAEGALLVLCGDAPLVDAKSLGAFMDFYEHGGLSLGVLTAVLDDPRSYGRIVREAAVSSGLPKRGTARRKN